MRSYVRTAAAIVAAAGVVGVGGVFVSGGGGPHGSLGGQSGVANLWIDEDGGTCVRQSIPEAYSSATACDTFQEAADAATTGDTILIQDGTYEGMQLDGTTKTLTFEAAGPGIPSFGQSQFDSSNITLRDILFENRDYPFAHNGGGAFVCSFWDYVVFVCDDNITFENVEIDGLELGKADGDEFRLGGLEVNDPATNFTFSGGEVHKIRDNKGMQGGGNNMLIEDVYFHDIMLTSAGAAADVHMECAAVTGGDNQTWRRNRFWQCSTINWVAQNYVGGPAFGPVILEGNVFAHPILTEESPGWQDGAPCLTIVGGNNGTNDVTGWIIRYNTFECDLNLGTPTAADEDDGLWYGNLGVDPGCSDADEWVVSFNVGQVCNTATGNIVVANALNTFAAQSQAPFYIDDVGGNFNLVSGSNDAVNIGSAPNVPSTDILGNSRPFGASVDAGAYERQS